MKKITLKKIRVYSTSRMRRLFPRRTLRYIDWCFKGDKTPVYGGLTFQESYNQTFGNGGDGYDKDVVKCFLNYGFSPLDYLLYGFGSINRTDASRRTFVSDWEKDAVLIQIEGWDNYLELSDKFGFYEKMMPFYKREVMKVDNNTRPEGFINFARKNEHLFLKPISDSYGNGARMMDYENDEQARAFFDSLHVSESSWVVEERILQSEEMAKWNESSVNTIRLNTYLNRNGFFMLAPFMRTGRKGSIVDNGGAGGIYALIDEKNGMIITDAHNEKGDSFINHPDSGIPFRGQVIPHWDELCAIAKRAHETIPSHIYISWDFALTDQGWVVVEGNWGQFIAQQTCSKIGYKKQFLEYMNGGVVSSRNT